MLQKVFVIGFPKTGTMSLGRALKVLGYRICPHLTVNGKALGISGAVTRDKLAPACLNIIGDYDGFRNFPWSAIYKELDAAIPEAKFILTVRQSEAWMDSMLRHFGERPLRLSEPLCGKSLPPKGNESLFHVLYQEHNVSVLNYFKDRPGKCLILDIEKADWRPLCGFLGRRRPLLRSFPHRNRGDLRERGASRIEKVIRYNLGDYIWRRRSHATGEQAPLPRPSSTGLSRECPAGIAMGEKR